MYLHGAPYCIAPSQQTHIPAFLWISDNFATDFRLNTQCLRNECDDPLSHDYIFHSLLGLFRIKTKEYQKNLICLIAAKISNIYTFALIFPL